MIESYHNKLKTFYLGRSRSHRIDRLIYMLSDNLVLDYRRDHIQTSLGIQPAKLSLFEKERRNIADGIEKQVAISMITKVNEQVITCIV